MLMSAELFGRRGRCKKTEESEFSADLPIVGSAARFRDAKTVHAVLMLTGEPPRCRSITV